MKRVDKEALTRAIALTRAENVGRRDQIDHKLRNEGFEEAGRFAAYHRQCLSLQLRPWQPPPMYVTVDTEDDNMGPIGGRRAAALLLQRMFDAGLSRWEPSPLEALARIEAGRQAKAS